MAIPDFQTIMRPLLVHLSDGEERTNRETLEALATEFGLSTDDLAELIPSGRQPLFYNRVAWAKTHLKAAACIESPSRGVYRITSRGRELLSTSPDRIDLGDLRAYPEYVEFRKPREDAVGVSETVESTLTPEEHLGHGYRLMRQSLKADLLNLVKGSSPQFFEKLVVELLVAMGYGGSRADAGRVLGRSGDGGVDGVINEDRLGLDVIYIQAKKWEGGVSRPEIQKFAGALQGHRAKKGVFITTSNFSADAKSYASSIESRIVLLDGNALTELMIDHGVGVTVVDSLTISRLDSDYFDAV